MPSGLQNARYEVHCETRITSGGSAQNPICYSLTDSAPTDLQRAVALAVLKSRFHPATRAGRIIDVYAVLMVIVDTRLHEPLILAVPNNGIEVSRYGLLYTAPQRYDDSYRMSQQLPLHTPGAGTMLMVFNIDEQGTVVSCNVRDTEHAPQRFIVELNARMRRMRFLPGYYEGNPVPMMYVEPHFWRS